MRVLLALLVMAQLSCELAASTLPTLYWIGINSNQSTIDFRVTNAPPGMPCELLSRQSISDTNFTTEASCIIPPERNWASFTIPLSRLTNACFFETRTSIPTNGLILVQLQATNSPITPIINDQLVTLTPIASNLVRIPPTITNLNFGYDGGDGGPTSIPFLDPQPISEIYGLTDLKELQFFCASQSPITRLDLHGLKKLLDVECYQSYNLTNVNITNCPNLVRACLEECAIQGQLNFSGDTNLEDIRGAVNHYTNVVLGGAGPKIWHFCVRDNPQLNQLTLTNFYSLREWFCWNCNQTGIISRTSMPSTNLYNIQIQKNRYTSADFTGSSNLDYLRIDNNRLTNLTVTGCTAITYLNAESNRLTQAALDKILTTLNKITNHGGQINLRHNAQYPSSAGYNAAAAMRTRTDPNKRWTVSLDYAAFTESTSTPGDGSPGDSSNITFVTEGYPGGSQITLALALSQPADVTWHWADGSVTTGVNNGSHSFIDQNAIYHTNYVTIDPPEALLGFGKPPYSFDYGIHAVSGLASFPNLTALYFNEDDLKDLSLANCQSLKQINLAENPAKPSTIDQWLIDLNNAVITTNPPGVADFYYPDGRTIASDAAKNALLSKGFGMHGE